MKKRLFFSTATAVALIASTVTPTAKAANFTDITDYPYEQAIKDLAASNVISGYKDGTFQPNRQLSRSDVVKILGKFLVSTGHSVPKDYKTKMRFTDLSATSSDELLRYAALVKDTGVFTGSNGRLLPNELMKREHMALVLVRAFSQLHKFDYVNYVKNETFLETYSDKDFLTTENAAAIRVFDYFNVTVDDYFRPKIGATRGEFAGALHQMMHLQRIEEAEPSIEHIDVITEDRITVTMTNGTKHNIRLQQKLADNTPTEISFEVYGKQYKQTVTYTVQALKILDVRNINGGQFVIEFNQPVDLANVYNQADLQKLLSIRMNKYGYIIPLLKGELSDDKRSFKVTVDASSAFAQDYYRLTVHGGIHSINGQTLKDYDNIYAFTKDTTSPTIAGVDYIGNSKVLVRFSEPISAWSYRLGFKTTTGETVLGIVHSYNRNNTALELNLKDAYITWNNPIAANQLIYGTFSDLTDLAGNKSLFSTVEVRKTNRDGISPKVMKVEQVGAKQFKVIFSEPIQPISSSKWMVSSGGEVNSIEEIEQVDKEATTFLFTVENYLDVSTIIRTRPFEYIYDLSGELASIYHVYDFIYNTDEAQLERTEINREQNNEYLYLYFDRNVKVAQNATMMIEGSYMTNGQRSFISEPKVARAYADTANPNVVRVLLSELLDGIDRENSNFDVEAKFANVTNEYGIALSDVHNLQFTRSKDFNYNYNQLEVLSVETSRTDASIKSSNTIVVNFNYNVDAQTATDLYNYDLERYEIVSATVNPTNSKQVILTTNSFIYSPTEVYLMIDDIRAQNAITRMEPFYDKVYLNETIRPTLISTAGTVLGNKMVLSSSVITARNEMTLSFSEAILPVQEDSFVVTNSTGSTLGVKAAVSKTDASKLVLTFDAPLLNNQTLTIALKPNRTITDLYYNESTFRAGVITIYNQF